MISPMGERQIHLTSNIEALRQAQDVAEHHQREAARKRAADDRLAEAQDEVPLISEAASLTTEERRNREKGQGHPGAKDGSADDTEAPDQATVQANPADNHLDFLA